MERHAWLSAIDADEAGHADGFVAVLLLRLTEIRAIRAPNDRREHLVGIGLTEIQESRVATRAVSVVRARHLAAHFLCLADVVAGLFRPDGLRFSWPRGKKAASHKAK